MEARRGLMVKAMTSAITSMTSIIVCFRLSICTPIIRSTGCSATYSLVNALNSYIKIRKRGCNLDIGCDFLGKKPEFRYDVVLQIRLGRVLAGFWRVVLAEAKRSAQEQMDQQK